MGILSDYAAAPILTSSGNRRMYYRSVTPFVLFAEKRYHLEWKQITERYMYSDPQIYVEKMGSLIKRRLQEELSAQVRFFHRCRSVSDTENIKGYGMEDFEDLHIESYFLYAGRCIENYTPTPLAKVIFSTEWNMPQFLGACTELGFGMIKPADGNRLPAYDPLLMAKKDMRKTNRMRKAS